MSNQITEQYFSYTRTDEYIKEITEALSIKTGFIIEREIFRGQIYDKDKIGSVIYKGKWKKKSAVLKIQFLKLSVQEVDIIEAFNNQNQSQVVGLPAFYAGEKWEESTGYGYLICEYIEGEKIYKNWPLKEEEVVSFCSFYEEYSRGCLNRAFWAPVDTETSTLVFINRRVSHWLSIAESRGFLTNKEISLTEEFLIVAAQAASFAPMSFMHGHLTKDDIFVLPNGDYILMSNLLWSYRPKYYDTTFHIWASFQSMSSPDISSKEVIKHLEEWFNGYLKIKTLAQDNNFKKAFFFNMAERCIGALLIDINVNQDSQERRGQLREIFSTLFNYCIKKIN